LQDVGNKQVAPTVANGCTNGCTNLPEDSNKTPLELDNATHSKCLELLASTPELLDLIDAWPELPEPVRAGVLAMVQAAKGAE